MTRFRSGFVTLVGRPNVGKSTLMNQIVGQKVSIVSDRPQTTRTQVRGVHSTPSSQLVFLDTPGIHRPRTLLGERTNQRALATLAEVDVVCQVVAANEGIGPGDEFVARLVAESGTASVLVVNKIDAAGRADTARRLADASARLGDVLGLRAVVGPHRRRGRRTGVRARSPPARGSGVLPGGDGERPARDHVGRRAGPGEAPRRRPRRTAPLDRGHRRAARGRRRRGSRRAPGEGRSSGSNAIPRRGS